jgi:hypothetical protein
MADGPPADRTRTDLKGVDPSRPNPARMYDYYLGGKDNFEADRAAAEQILKMAPETVHLARENRAFLGRALTLLLDEGIGQFLDIGTGIPAGGNVPDIVTAARPDVRVICVDNDPVACVHARALTHGRVRVLEADMREPAPILAAMKEEFDLSRPVGLIMASVLHFIPDDALARATVAAFRDALPPGSALVLTHGTTVGLSAETEKESTQIYRKSSAAARLRSPEEIAVLFDGFELVEPGLVNAAEWRPDAPVAGRPGARAYAGVGFLRQGRK